MKTRDKIIFVLGIILAIYFVWYTFWREPNIKAGQVWVYTYGNPFEEHIKTNIVLEVRGKWVKYYSFGKSWFSNEIWTNTTINTVDWFVFGSKRIK